MRKLKVGDIVSLQADSVSEYPFGVCVLRGITGIVAAVKNNDGVNVQFEIGEKLVSRPIRCYPFELALDPSE